jgi:hypothetical protein
MSNLSYGAHGDDRCSQFAQINRFYLLPSLSGIGILLNSILIITFMHRKLRTNLIFCYLRAKIISDTFILLGRILYAPLKCKTCPYSQKYELHFISLLINDYIKQIFPLLSVLCEMIATFCQYIQMRNLFDKFKEKVNHLAVLAVLSFIISAFYVYEMFSKTIFVNKINFDNKTNSTIKLYKSKTSEFGDSDAYKYLKLASSMFRDVFCIVLIVILNFFMLYEYRKLVKRKKQLKKSKNKKELRSQRRLTKMVFIIGLVVCAGHLPYSLKYIRRLEENVCLEEAVNLMYVMSILSYFFIYYIFNNVLRTFSIDIFRRLLRIESKKEKLYSEKSTL